MDSKLLNQMFCYILQLWRICFLIIWKHGSHGTLKLLGRIQSEFLDAYPFWHALLLRFDMPQLIQGNHFNSTLVVDLPKRRWPLVGCISLCTMLEWQSSELPHLTVLVWQSHRFFCFCWFFFELMAGQRCAWLLMYVVAHMFRVGGVNSGWNFEVGPVIHDRFSWAHPFE